MSVRFPLQPSTIDPAAPALDTPNQAALIRAVFEGADGVALVRARLSHLQAHPEDGGGFIALGTLYQLIGRRDEALACQDAAFLHGRVFREAPSPVQTPTFTLLVFVTHGDLMTNTPIELLLEGRPVQVLRLYVDADLPLPAAVPEHDLAMIAISEADATRPLLERLRGLDWPRPLINDAGAILDLGRDRLWRKLEGVEGLDLPATVRAPRGELGLVVTKTLGLTDVLPGAAFPLLVRPVGSHAGQSLARIDGFSALKAYLDRNPAELFYVSRFVDYAGHDGRFRKYRVAMFDGRPYIAHMAVGDHWMVHYLNAGMAESAQKRADEAAAMAGFEHGFAVRHAGALAEIGRRLGLDYFALDCAETRDGELLVFEADVGMIVHALDPEALYPYKKPQMEKVFAAFEAMLRRKALGRKALAG